MKEIDDERETNSTNDLKLEMKLLQQNFRELNERYNDTRILYEASKKNEMGLQEIISGLKHDIVMSEKRYEALKVHAEEKLNK